MSIETRRRSRQNVTDVDRSTDVDDRDEYIRVVERAQGNDPTAMEELIAMFRPFVYGIARRKCWRTCDVDDIVQEVWAVLMTSIDSIHSPACFPGWLRRVAENVVIAHAKKNRAIPLAELPEPREAREHEDVAYRHLEAEATRRSINHALGRLSSPDRALLGLLMASDRPNYAVVSRTIERPMGSIGPTRSRVLRRLSSDPAIVRLTNSDRARVPAF
jgi:RNA polymerase sigma factor (sigma-70 family)